MSLEVIFAIDCTIGDHWHVAIALEEHVKLGQALRPQPPLVDELAVVRHVGLLSYGLLRPTALSLRELVWILTVEHFCTLQKRQRLHRAAHRLERGRLKDGWMRCAEREDRETRLDLLCRGCRSIGAHSSSSRYCSLDGINIALLALSLTLCSLSLCVRSLPLSLAGSFGGLRLRDTGQARAP
jgi:hypothetical protein